MPIRIKILLVLHLLAMPMGAYAASEFDGIAPHPLGVVVISLGLADAGLLGLWGGLGETRWWLRFGCIVVLLLCLAPALFMADIGRCELDLDYVSVVASPAIVVSFLLLLLRRKGRLLLTRSALSLEASNDSQFSLAHMLLATAIIAAGFAIRGGLQEFNYDITILAVVACSTLVSFAMFWSAFGPRRPLFRLLIVVPAAALLGLIFPILSSSSSADVLTVTDENVLWLAILGCQALFTSATLLVFRSCGWRLCRMAGGGQAAPIEVAGSSEASQAATLCDR
jgi:hypothetical protein